MRRICAGVSALLLLWITGNAFAQRDNHQKTAAGQSRFPHVICVRLWYLHPPSTFKLVANPGQARLRKCVGCAEVAFSSLTLGATGSRIQIDGDKAITQEVRVAGTYQIAPAAAPNLKADFPIDLRANDGHLLVTASMPMDEYIAGVLAGETGTFKSDETLKAMAVTARTYAMHFGSRHALDGFDFCDSTHCQNLSLSDVTPRLRKIVEATAGEVLWYDGEPAATYYHANCGGTTEDGRFILGNDEQRAPYLKQHSDSYCVRNGASQWSSEVSKQELQRALAAEGVRLPGQLQAVAVLERTASGRVEFLTVTGSQSMMVPGLTFRAAIGHNIGWDRLKSNWYDVRVEGDKVVAVGDSVSRPAGAEVIDLGDATLMPGLIDAHVHLFLHPGAEDLQTVQESVPQRTLRSQ